MGVHRIKKGLDLPISGAPEQVIHDGPNISRVALVGDDYHGLRARMCVEEGETVRRGQLLFEDRTTPGVRYTAPGAGRVAAINRGRRRALQSLVVQLDSTEEGVEFESNGRDARALLVESGLWTSFRTRPFSRVPAPDTTQPTRRRDGLVPRTRVRRLRRVRDFRERIGPARRWKLRP